MAKIETRTLTASLRSAEGDFALEGYAATYNRLSHDLGNYREQIAPTAFGRSLREKHDVRCLFNHDSNRVLGRVANGTLQLSSDNRGLKFRCQLDKNQQSHRDLYSSVQRGDISDCSFAFQCPEGGCDFNYRGMLEDGKTPCNIRTLRDLKLLDVSVVTTPAYPATSVDARQCVTVDDQAEIKKQIALWEQRQRKRIADARSLMAENSPLDAETLLRAKKFGYSEDLLLELRAAAYAKQIREGRWS